VNNPLASLARALGTKPWLMKTAPAVIWADKRLHRFTKGRVSLVALAGLPSLRLTTIGRKSGLARSTNLLFYPYGEEFVLTGSNWGRPRDPAWTFNLRAHPEAKIFVRGKEIPVVARPVEGTEYAEVWRLLLSFWPGYEMERAAAGRQLPLFVLARITR
jgi:deazaflavin-dependent oxidoreductase (nitroreductase family)